MQGRGGIIRTHEPDAAHGLSGISPTFSSCVSPAVLAHIWPENDLIAAILLLTCNKSFLSITTARTLHFPSGFARTPGLLCLHVCGRLGIACDRCTDYHTTPLAGRIAVAIMKPLQDY